MNAEEKKAWEEMVEMIRAYRDGIDTEGWSEYDPVILAADAELPRLRAIAANEKGLLDIIKGDEKELKRLREALEWAIHNEESRLYQWQRDELRRRAAK